MTKEAIKKKIHFLKTYKDFFESITWGVITVEKVNEIAETTWRIENILEASNQLKD